MDISDTPELECLENNCLVCGNDNNGITDCSKIECQSDPLLIYVDNYINELARVTVSSADGQDLTPYTICIEGECENGQSSVTVINIFNQDFTIDITNEFGCPVEYVIGQEICGNGKDENGDGLDSYTEEDIEALLTSNGFIKLDVIFEDDEGLVSKNHKSLNSGRFKIETEAGETDFMSPDEYADKIVNFLGAFDTIIEPPSAILIDACDPDMPLPEFINLFDGLPSSLKLFIDEVNDAIYFKPVACEEQIKPEQAKVLNRWIAEKIFNPLVSAVKNGFTDVLKNIGNVTVGASVFVIDQLNTLLINRPEDVSDAVLLALYNGDCPSTKPSTQNEPFLEDLLIPKCWWEDCEGAFLIPPLVAGVSDGAVKLVQGANSFLEFIAAWDPRSTFFVTSTAKKIRENTIDVFVLLYKIIINEKCEDDPTMGVRDKTVTKIKSALSKYFENIDQLTCQGQYYVGQLAFEIIFELLAEKGIGKFIDIINGNAIKNLDAPDRIAETLKVASKDVEIPNFQKATNALIESGIDLNIVNPELVRALGKRMDDYPDMIDVNGNIKYIDEWADFFDDLPCTSIGARFRSESNNILKNLPTCKKLDKFIELRDIAKAVDNSEMDAQQLASLNRRINFWENIVKGTRFEDKTVADAFSSRDNIGGPNMDYITMNNGVGPNIDLNDYDVFTNMTIHFDPVFVEGKWVSKFRADQVLVKVEIVEGIESITDIIIFENKLKPTTALSKNQFGALGQIKIKADLKIGGKSRMVAHTSRNRIESGITTRQVEALMVTNTKLNKKISFKQVSDSDIGDVVTTVEDL